MTPELTTQTIVEGWLLTGDQGRFEKHGHLQLFGRKKNMIVTEGGKNIYPEDIESVFDGLPVKEYCVFAANYLWPQKTLGKRERCWCWCCGWSRISSSTTACATRSWRGTGACPISSESAGTLCGRRIFRGPRR